MGHYLYYISPMTKQNFQKIFNMNSDQHNVIEFEKNIPGGEFHLIWKSYPYLLELCYPQIKYSKIVWKDPQSIKVVEKLDKEISDFISNEKIYRIDELILEEYELGNSENWKFDPDLFSDFEKWVENKDSKHWKRIN